MWNFMKVVGKNMIYLFYISFLSYVDLVASEKRTSASIYYELYKYKQKFKHEEKAGSLWKDDKICELTLLIWKPICWK